MFCSYLHSMYYLSDILCDISYKSFDMENIVRMPCYDYNSYDKLHVVNLQEPLTALEPLPFYKRVY